MFIANLVEPLHQFLLGLRWKPFYTKPKGCLIFLDSF
jgi:hypothetical protein